MRRGGGPHQVQEDVRSRSLTSWWARNRKNSAGSGCFSRAWDQGAILPHSRQRGLLDRGQENRGFDGELPEGYRLVLNYRRWRC